MYPVLFNIGPFIISSFGVFLVASLGLGSFIIWRLAQVYDLDREKVIDLILISFVIALFGARVLYILINLEEVNSFEKMFFINKYPGFSLWGGILTGLAALLVFSKKFKFNFWLIADFAIVGFFAGAILESLGCLLSGCMYGYPSNLIIAAPIVGIIEDRFPIQVIYALFYFAFFIVLWKRAIRFHFQGAIFSLGLIFFGTINLILGFFRGDQEKLLFDLSLNTYFSAASILAGLRLYFYLGKRSFRRDLGKFKLTLTSKVDRERYLLKLKKYWYNALVQVRESLLKGFKKTGRKLNVKENPREF